MIVAAIPDFEEDVETLGRALGSLGEAVLGLVYAGGIRGPLEEGFAGPDAPFGTQAEMREYGFRLARNHSASWVLQMDADERLVNGELLAPILSAHRRCYPLPIVQENGRMTLAPFKCLESRPLTFVASCDQIRWPDLDEVWRLSGYTAPDELIEALLELPHLVHEPSLRPEGRRSVRLPEVERVPGAVQWPLPPLTLKPKERLYV